MNEQEWNEHVERWSQERKQGIEKAKAALFGYLADCHPDIARIEIHYDGYGDEGNVRDTFYYTTLDGDDKGVELKDDKMDDLIEDVFDRVTPDGFEVNDGGNGVIHIYPDTCTIKVEHYQNIVEQEFESYEV